MGPLSGIKVIEMKGIGPGPYAGMLLADMGAEVIVVERASKPNGIALPAEQDVNGRGKKSIALDIKKPEGLEVLLELVSKSHMLLEGFRPGVAERLGFGPIACLQRNKTLVYGRITGWGQSGPLASTAGHDINFIALTGALAAIGDAEKPSVPLNVVGDYAGGSLFLVMGMLAAHIEAQRTGIGQVVDSAITDGSASLMSIFYSLSQLGVWAPKRQSNLLDGAAPFYGVYKTGDDKHMAVGAIEPQFYTLLLKTLGLDPNEYGSQNDQRQWPKLRLDLERRFASQSREYWSELFADTDACVTPVLDYTEAPNHVHNKERETYVEINGVNQPAPAPRFSGNKTSLPAASVAEGTDTVSVLLALGYSENDIRQLKALGVVSYR